MLVEFPKESVEIRENHEVEVDRNSEELENGKDFLQKCREFSAKTAHLPQELQVVLFQEILDEQH